MLTTLQAELRDRTLFRFDSQQGQGDQDCRLEKRLQGSLATLDLKRGPEGKGWVVAESTFKEIKEQLNPLQVEILLGELSHALVESFVQGGPKPEYELDKDRTTWQIE